MGFNSGLKGLKKNYGNPRRPVTRLWLREYEKIQQNTTQTDIKNDRRGYNSYSKG